MRALNRVSTLFAVLTLAALFMLGVFSAPVSDDFCFAAAALRDGFVSSQVTWYQGWTGRYSSTLMVSLTGVLPLSWYGVFPWAALLATLGGLMRLLLALGGPALRRVDAVQAAVLLMLVYSASLPSVLEAYFWAAGALTYQFANGLALWLAGQLILLCRPAVNDAGAAGASRAPMWGLCAAVAFFLAGCNEILMLIMDGLLAAALLHAWHRKLLCARGLLLVLGAAAAGTLIVLIAPGNAVRLSMFADNRDVLAATGQSAALTLRLLMTWLSTPAMWLLAWLALAPIERAAPDWLKTLLDGGRAQKRASPLLLAALFVLLMFCVFPSWWSTGQAPPSRARTLPLLLFCLVWPLLFWSVARDTLADLHLTARARGVARFVLMASLVWSVPAQQWFRDLGSGYRYWREGQLQAKLISAARAGGIRELNLPFSANPPRSLTAPEFMFTGDKNNYANKCFARYHGFESVQFSAVGGRGK